MQTIFIDGKEYDLDTLSDAAKGQLASLQFVDRELERLRAQAAVLQTARNTYANALTAALPRDAVDSSTESEATTKPVSTAEVTETPVATEGKPTKKKGLFFK